MPNPTRARTGAKVSAAAAPAGFKQGERDRIRLDPFIVMPQRTRDLNLKHVVSLADSIAAIGLIHPPAVDRADRLLAGAHRFAALLWLQDHARARFLELFPDGVPVWRMDLNVEADMDLALAVEISENEQRRDYQPAEILQLSDLKRFLDASRRITTQLATASELPEVAALQAELGRVDRLAGKALAAPGQ